MWSVGCIFAELLLKEPLFQAKGELELISMIFKLLGPPTSTVWPEYSSLPLAKTVNLPAPHPPQLRQKFPYITATGLDLLSQLMTYDPEQRISAEEAIKHPYFRSAQCVTLSIDRNDMPSSESPYPKHPDLFGSFPSAAAGEKYVPSLPSCFRENSCSIHLSRRQKPYKSPSAPARAADYKLLTEFDMP